MNQDTSSSEISSEATEVVDEQSLATEVSAEPSTETQTEPTAETKVDAEVEAAVKAEEQKFAQKFAALSRKEKSIRDREKLVEKRMKELDAKQPEFEKNAANASKEVEELKRRLRSEPIKLMEEFGLSFQQLAEMVLNDGKPTADMVMNEKERAIQSKIDALEQKLQAKEQAEEQARLDAAINGFKGQIKDLVANTEAYELVRVNEAADIIYDVIVAHHEETGEVLDIKSAADAVEAHLLEEAKKHLDLPKIRGLLQPTPQQPPATAEVKPASKTLTNASAAKASSQVSRKLSNEESMLEAARLIKWSAE
jgi:hypothetical protein